MEQQPIASANQPPDDDSWLDVMLQQSSLVTPDPLLPEADERFTRQVMSALPPTSAAHVLWRMLPLAAILGSVSAALWYLTGPLAPFLDQSATLPMPLLLVAVLYWVCWETCFAERPSRH